MSTAHELGMMLVVLVVYYVAVAPIVDALKGATKSIHISDQPSHDGNFVRFV